MKKENSGQAKSGMTNVNMISSTHVRRADIIRRKDGLNPRETKKLQRLSLSMNQW